METGIKVLDAMTRMPVTVNSSLSVVECAKLMMKNNVGSLIVRDGLDVKGILTERDLTRKVIAKGIDGAQVTASEVMTRDMVTGSPTMDIYDALIHMNNFDVRHLPVMNNGELVGFITMKDILKIQPELFELIADTYSLREEDTKPVLKRFQRMIEPYY